jgi:hypothetical protein
VFCLKFAALFPFPQDDNTIAVPLLYVIVIQIIIAASSGQFPDESRLGA